jgi:hypothetical protein
MRPAKWGSGLSLHSSNPEPLMSALGQKQTLPESNGMSALPPKADITPKSQILSGNSSYEITSSHAPNADAGSLYQRFDDANVTLGGVA